MPLYQLIYQYEVFLIKGTGPVYVSTSDARVQIDDTPPSDAQRTYLCLKEMIVTLGLRPGSTINEVDLQEHLGVGRTPLREALQHLSNDGLLQIYPRRAIVVAQLDVPKVRQIFEMRLLLEPAAANLAAQIVTDTEIDDLRSVVFALSGYSEQGDVFQFLHDDFIFHRYISSYSRNIYLVAYVEHMLTLNQWLWHIYFDSRGVDRRSLFQHEPIVDALAARDAASAEEAMRQHILGSKEQLLSGL